MSTITPGAFRPEIAAPGSLRTGLLRRFAGTLLPPVCCLCGAAGQPPDLDLCDVCATFLPAHRVMGSASIGALSGLAPTLVRLVVPFHYAYPVDRMIRALKFQGERIYARVLGAQLALARIELMQATAGSSSPALSYPDRLVPMPLHLRRYRERGFNQAEALARFAARHLGVRVDSRSLVRCVDTQEQSGLSVQARRLNVRQAFATTRSLQGQHVALIDDVLTTGSTALAAGRALIDAGVKELEVWAVARVDAPSNATGEST